MPALLQHLQGRDLFDPLLPAGVRFSEHDAIEAFGRVWKELVVRINGDAWKLTDMTVEELREKKYPKLLSP